MILRLVKTGMLDQSLHRTSYRSLRSYLLLQVRGKDAQSEQSVLLQFFLTSSVLLTLCLSGGSPH